MFPSAVARPAPTALEPGAPARMRAAVHHRFGGPDVVRIEKMQTPQPRAGEVLVRVHASTVSAADRRSRSRDVPRGLAVPSALVLGVFRPRRGVLGMDAAGVVEAIGPGVTAFSVGDEIVAMLGSRFGGHAEYVTIPVDSPIAVKPGDLSFEEAAALVFGGITARAYLNRARLTAGSRVLVNGASGAVGTAAVQLAKMADAHVTAVTSGRNAGLAWSLGADRVIDYERIDFAAERRTYDVIVDTVGNVPFDDVEAVIDRGGALLQIIADLGDVVRAGRRARRSGKKIVAGSVPFAAEDLQAVMAAGASGWLRPVIDRTVDLADIADAHRYVDTGRKRGSVVVRIADSGSSAARPATVAATRA